MDFPQWNLEATLNQLTNRIDITSNDDSIPVNQYLHKLFVDQVGGDVFIICCGQDKNLITFRGHKNFLMTVSMKLYKTFNVSEDQLGDKMLDYHKYSEELVKVAFDLIYLKECSIDTAKFETLLKFLYNEWEMISMKNLAQVMETINSPKPGPNRFPYDEYMLSEEETPTEYSDSPTHFQLKMTQPGILHNNMASPYDMKKRLAGVKTTNSYNGESNKKLKRPTGGKFGGYLRPPMTPPASNNDANIMEEVVIHTPPAAENQLFTDTHSNGEINSGNINNNESNAHPIKNGSNINVAVTNVQVSPSRSNQPPAPKSKKVNGTPKPNTNNK